VEGGGLSGDDEGGVGGGALVRKCGGRGAGAKNR